MDFWDTLGDIMIAITLLGLFFPLGIVFIVYKVVKGAVKAGINSAVEEAENDEEEEN